MNKIILLFIRLYQKTISPDHGWIQTLRQNKEVPLQYCRFTPTCSEYGYTAVKKHGTIKGTFLAMKRIIRCNPFSTPMGTHDPVN